MEYAGKFVYMANKVNKPGERIGVVKYGEKGYYLTDFDVPTDSFSQVEEFVAGLNRKLGIPEDVAESAVYASIFGWHVPVADRAHAFFTRGA